MEEEEKNFLYEWMKYGDSKEKEEKEFGEPYRFVSYYIAFNFLYNRESRERVNRDGDTTESELNQIYNFLDTCKKEKIYFNSYELLDKNSEYCIKSVESMRKPYIKAFVNAGTRNLHSIFRAIYIVRCNLFHGSKSMIDPRNRKLLEDGSKILKDLLVTYLNKKINYIRHDI